jgi:ABC-type phosphate transport system substrate-binding protein
MKRFKTIAIIAALWVGSAQAGEEEIAVVVNSANPVQKLSQSELRPIFQTTRTTWSNGDKIIALNSPESESSRKGFDAAVLGLDPDRVARYWVDRKIRGGDAPPKVVPSPAAVLKVVAAKSEAIGYVRASELNKTVKVVARIRNGEVVAP